MNSKDLETLKAEEENKRTYLKAQQYIFEQQMKGSMGQEMKEWLNNPPKPIPKKETLFDKIKNKIKKKS